MIMFNIYKCNYIFSRRTVIHHVISEMKIMSEDQIIYHSNMGVQSNFVTKRD